MTRYLILATIGSTLFFGVYWLLMRKETRFQMVRWYLLGTLALSLTLPAIHISVAEQDFALLLPYSIPTAECESGSDFQGPMVTASGMEYFSLSAENVPTAETQNVTFKTQEHTAPAPFILKSDNSSLLTTLGSLYIAGCAVMFILLLIRFCTTIRELHRFSFNAQNIAFLDDETPAFSFFGRIVVGRKGFTDEEVQQLIGHEQVHVRQHHSLDISFAELAKVLLWFNPFAWLYCRELRRVHEYIADKKMLGKATGSDYAALFYHEVSGHRYCPIGNNFDYKITQKRITMMTQSKSRFGGLTPLMALPIAALVLFANCQFKNQDSDTPMDTVTICQDAANGDYAISRSLVTNNDTIGTVPLFTLEIVNGKVAKCYSSGIETPITLDYPIISDEAAARSYCAAHSEDSLSVEMLTAIKGKVLDGIDTTRKPCWIVTPKHIYDMVSNTKSAQFPKGNYAMTRYFQTHVDRSLVEEPEELNCYFQVQIESDGTIAEVQQVKGINEKIDKNVLEAVRNMPKWEPAQCNGNPASCWIILDVYFHRGNVGASTSTYYNSDEIIIKRVNH